MSEQLKKRVISYCCEQCNSNTLEMIVLSEKEIEQKLKDFEYKKPFFMSKSLYIRALFMGYTAFQCPRCKWIKFVKNSTLENMTSIEVEKNGEKSA
jgi:phage FluMu protein Com